jgi:RHS repeat-associated protein
MVGDHLGSTTLVLDTSTPPQVIHRQYYKPYGEVAVQSGSSRTSIGYTGQRLDQDSGLMFYNARFYDPVLSYFVSADTIAPDKGDPKRRNRYSYLLNNLYG